MLGGARVPRGGVGAAGSERAEPGPGAACEGYRGRPGPGPGDRQRPGTGEGIAREGESEGSIV
jgi:hypothetical protein